MDPQIVKIFNWMIALVVSLACHECAHAWAAKLQGDHTAEREGRLTLNPLAHIDLIGTIILPLVMIATSGGMFGWAKPVPVNLRNLKHPKWGHVIVAAAGPVSNLILCFGFVLAATAYSQLNPTMAENDLFMAIAGPMIKLNAILAIFNLIPIAPLDGGTVFPALLPQNLERIYEEYIAPNGMWILVILMISGALQWVSLFANSYITMSLKVARMFV